MQKTLTKEKLAEQLDGRAAHCRIPKGLLELAEKNNLLIVRGHSDDIVAFSGAWTDEDYVYDGGITLISREGRTMSDCDSEECPYYKSWVRQAIASGEVLEIKVFWYGQCKKEAMDSWTYNLLGRPAWHYTCESIADKSVPFTVFYTDEEDSEYFCRGFVIDLDEVWPIDRHDH